MKLYKLLPTCGLALGVALVIATSAFKEAPKDKSGDPLYTFQYTGPSDYSQTEVEDVSNWAYTADTDPCDNHNVEACKVQVPESYVDNPTSSPTLDASINIGATVSSNGTAYVSSTDAGSSAVISNKHN